MKQPLDVLKLYPPHDYTLQGAFASRAGRNPQRPFILYDNRTWSWESFDAAVLSIAAAKLGAARVAAIEMDPEAIGNTAREQRFRTTTELLAAVPAARFVVSRPEGYPELRASGLHLFVGQFSYMMTALLVMAAPAMVLLLLIDLSFGLVNRYAPQLNVFALTLPIKAWIATAMTLLLLGVFVEIVLTKLAQNRALLGLLDRAFS